MPVTNGIGHSEETPYKQECLGKILEMHMKISRAIIKRGWPSKYYHYFDMNAGCGENSEEEVDGSPVIFQNTAVNLEMKFRAGFAEKDTKNMEQLSTCLLEHGCKGGCCGGDWSDVQIDSKYDFFDDNEKLFDWMQQTPSNAFGLIYADPNGIPPFEPIKKACALKNSKRIDVLIYFGATSLKRCCKEKLLDHLQSIDKEQWLVREPEGRWQWTFLLGTNWPKFPEYERIGFFRITSERGIEILKKLNFTNKELSESVQLPLIQQEPEYKNYQEYLNHPKFKKIRAMAFERAGGKCECCKKRPPTEPHHLVYPKWGTFEENANFILAVCHECHCILEGKAA